LTTSTSDRYKARRADESPAKSPVQEMSGQRGIGLIIAGDFSVENAILWKNMLMAVDDLSRDKPGSGSEDLPDHGRQILGGDEGAQPACVLELSFLGRVKKEVSYEERDTAGQRRALATPPCRF
jgi:hypothetical protein